MGQLQESGGSGRAAPMAASAESSRVRREIPTPPEYRTRRARADAALTLFAAER